MSVYIYISRADSTDARHSGGPTGTRYHIHHLVAPYLLAGFSISPRTVHKYIIGDNSAQRYIFIVDISSKTTISNEYYIRYIATAIMLCAATSRRVHRKYLWRVKVRWNGSQRDLRDGAIRTEVETRDLFGDAAREARYRLCTLTVYTHSGCKNDNCSRFT